MPCGNFRNGSRHPRFPASFMIHNTRFTVYTLRNWQKLPSGVIRSCYGNGSSTSSLFQNFSFGTGSII
jgi:hypothetical protein